jgi:hypothetical protein
MAKVQKTSFEERFEVCPACGYKDGFHIILIKEPTTPSLEMKFQLKCPSCAQIYDLNLYCSIKQ